MPGVLFLMSITHDDLKAWFNYNKKTGVLSWKVQKRSRGGLTQIGQPVGCPDGRYLKTTLLGQSYIVHRVIWFYVTGKWPEFDIDHKNGDGMDNRWSNLREAPGSINQENFRRAFKSNQSGLIGAWPSTDGKRWRSIIQVDRQPKFLGYFDTAEQAHAAYLRAKRQLHKGCTI